MTTKIHYAREINEGSSFNSAVDIIIPYHGQYEKVATLLKSIFLLTRSNYYHIYLVDDCSPNQSYLKTIKYNTEKNAERMGTENVLTCIRTSNQKGFAGACKEAFSQSSNPYVCFINSDCEIVDSGWLRRMGESLLKLKAQGVRMIAPMTNNPVGGDPAQKGDKFSRDNEDVIVGDDSFLTMYCFLCHRGLFERCGGFLKEYPLGYFEDEEFAARMRKKEFKQAVCRSSWIYHEGQATIRDLWRENPENKNIMEEENRNRCIEDLKTLI